MTAVAEDGTAIVQMRVKPKVSLSDTRTGEAANRRRTEPHILECGTARKDKIILRRRLQRSVVAVRTTNLTKGWDIGAHNSTVTQHRFDHRKAESLDDGRREKQLA